MIQPIPSLNPTETKWRDLSCSELLRELVRRVKLAVQKFFLTIFPCLKRAILTSEEKRKARSYAQELYSRALLAYQNGGEKTVPGSHVWHQVDTSPSPRPRVKLSETLPTLPEPQTAILSSFAKKASEALTKIVEQKIDQNQLNLNKVLTTYLSKKDTIAAFLVQQTRASSNEDKKHIVFEEINTLQGNNCGGLIQEYFQWFLKVSKIDQQQYQKDLENKTKSSSTPQKRNTPFSKPQDLVTPFCQWLFNDQEDKSTLPFDLRAGNNDSARIVLENGLALLMEYKVKDYLQRLQQGLKKEIGTNSFSNFLVSFVNSFLQRILFEFLMIGIPLIDTLEYKKLFNDLLSSLKSFTIVLSETKEKSQKNWNAHSKKAQIPEPPTEMDSEQFKKEQWNQYFLSVFSELPFCSESIKEAIQHPKKK